MGILVWGKQIIVMWIESIHSNHFALNFNYLIHIILTPIDLLNITEISSSVPKQYKAKPTKFIDSMHQ